MSSNDFEKSVNEYVEIIRKMPLIIKKLTGHWISGSSASVYPVTVGNDSIDIQWNEDKEPARIMSELEELGETMGVVKGAYFWKSDGSCPSKIHLMLSQPLNIQKEENCR